MLMLLFMLASLYSYIFISSALVYKQTGETLCKEWERDREGKSP